MKKVISLLLCISFLLMISACSPKKDTISEEELRAKIKTEMEDEERKKEELKAEIKTEMEKEKNNEASEKTPKEDEKIITTYAYFDNDEIDSSGLKRIELDCFKLVEEKTPNKDLLMSGDRKTHKLAIFGKVKNLSVDFAVGYEFGSFELVTYDTLEDTQLAFILGSQAEQGIIISFSDVRGKEYSFRVQDGLAVEVDKFELKSNVSKEEKQPTSYTAYDLSEFTKYIGMSLEDFKKSSIFKSVKVELGAEDNEYFVLVNGIKGFDLTLNPSTVWNEQTQKIGSIGISKNDDYGSLSKADKHSFYGIDFDMTEFGAKYNFKAPDDYKIDLFGNESENYIMNGMYISK